MGTVKTNKINKSKQNIKGKNKKSHKNKRNKGSKLIKKKRTERNYNIDDVVQALNAIKEGKSMRAAAFEFGVPKTSLLRKFTGESTIDCKKGAPSILTEDEENDFVKWILYSSNHGFPVNKKQLLDAVKKYVMKVGKANPFTNNRPGDKWYRSFMKRHPNLAVRTAQNLTTTRASVTETILREWFSKLQVYLKEKDLINIEHSRVFNLDESNFMLVPPKDGEVIAEKGARNVYKLVSANEKGSLTVLFCACASGELLPPMILFDVKTLPRKNVLEKIPSDWAVGNTESGWMTCESFYKYITNVFYNWLVSNQVQFPVILYVDGHASHLSMELAQFCMEKQIEMILLYPNATHIIQPLDVALFSTLKRKYKAANEAWRIENSVIDVTKAMFAPILKRALDDSDFTDCIKNGFRTCDLLPFDADAVNYNILNKNRRRQNQSSIRIEEANHDKDIAASESGKYSLFLEMFEEEFISSDLLNIFKKNESQEFWTGEIKNENLFNFWKKLKRLSENNGAKNCADGIAVINAESTIDSDSNVCIDMHIPNVNQTIFENANDRIEDFDLHNSEIILLEENPMFDVNSMDHFAENNFPTDPSKTNTPGIFEIVVSDENLTESLPVVVKSHIDCSTNKSLDDHEKLSVNCIKNKSPSSCNFDSISHTDASQIFLQGKNSFVSENDFEKEATNSIHISHDKTDLSENSELVNDDSSNINNSLSSLNLEVLDLSTSSTSSTHYFNYKETFNVSATPTKILTESDKSNILPNNSNNKNDIHESSDPQLCDSSRISSKSSDNMLDISPTLREVIPVRKFNKLKKKISNHEVTVNNVSQVLKTLREKEEEKMMKENEILLNKKKREEIKRRREELSDHKKRLNQEKSKINLKIKELKKIIKLETIQENKLALQVELKKYEAEIEQLEEKRVRLEIDALQYRIKIKQEKD